MSVSLLRPFPSGGLCGRLELMQKEPRRGCDLLLLLVTVIRQLMQASQGNISPHWMLEQQAARPKFCLAVHLPSVTYSSLGC